MAVRLAKTMCTGADNFGRDERLGAAAPKGASNAAGIGSMPRILTPGIPDSPVAAIMMADMFMRWGLIPGP